MPAEQAMAVQLLVERVAVQEEALEVRIRASAWWLSCGRSAKESGMMQRAETRLDGTTLVVRIPH